jgi:Arylsulfotransferase (ASST)
VNARRKIALAAATLTVLAVPAVPAAAAEKMRMTGSPALIPSFDPDTTDYVSHCGETGSLELSFYVPPGETASVDEGPARAGTFDEVVHLGAGEQVVVNARLADRNTHFHVRCLPADFPTWVARRTGSTQAQWYLASAAHHAIFFDRNGVPVWWKRARELPLNPTFLPNGNVAWFEAGPSKFGRVPDEDWDEFRLSGAHVRTIGAVGTPTDSHEIQQLPNGHYLVDAYRPRRGVDLSRYDGPEDALVYEAEVQELDRRGKLVWKWNSHGRIALSEAGRYLPGFVKNQAKHPPSERYYDVVHVNSITPDGAGYVISCRHTDALYRIDKRSGRIDWKLGGKKTARSLKVAGGARIFGGQHDVRRLPDGTITVFDNGLRRARPPRLLRFRIDRKARTAKLIETLSDPDDVPRSTWGGSARRLPGGNWVTAWGGTAYFSELTPAGRTVFGLYLPEIPQYRAQPLPYGELKPERLRDAMDRMHPRTP